MCACVRLQQESQLHYYCLQIPEPPLSNLDDQMKYTDNEAYFTFSRGQPASVKSGVKILSDNKNDGKEIVILPDNR